MTAMLVALSLEVCGCDLARDAARPFGNAVGQSARLPRLAEQPPFFFDPTEAAIDVSSASRIAGKPSASVPPELIEAKPVPWAIPESVFFVYRGGERNRTSTNRQPIATAFVVSVPDRSHRRFVRFLVTARHVVDPDWAQCSEKNPSSIDLRLNRRSGGVGYETIPLQSKHRRRFFTPSDTTSDIAVILLDQSLIPNLNDYKFIDVPFRLLPTESEMGQFRPAQPVTTARVPQWPSHESGDFPVFDAGVLSNMPSETVDVRCGGARKSQPQSKPLHLWFIDTGVPQGVSGAPVYAAIVRGAEAAKTPVLLGVQSVTWPDRGTAGITPSAVLGDLIQSALRASGLEMDFYRGPGPRPPETAPSLY